MHQHGLPLLYVVFVWWFATGAILYLDGLPRRTYRWTMLGASGALAAGCAALWMVREDTSAMGAYVAFAGSLAIWAWNEMAFLTGWITGPRTTPLSPHVRGWRRFVQASETIIWHEIAILLGFVLVAALSWGATNTLGVQVYAVLWAMRLSAKLNMFLGVPHAPVDFLPARLRHLASCFRDRPMNGLFPVSITVSTVICASLAIWAWQAGRAPETLGAAVGYTFLSGLLALAILEHWFLVLPLPSEKLWKWGMRSHDVVRLPIDTPLGAPAIPSYADVKTKGSRS